MTVCNTLLYGRLVSRLVCRQVGCRILLMMLNMVIRFQQEYFCLINVDGKTWQGCVYTGCTQHLDHYWWAARNEAGTRMIYVHNAM